MINQCGSTGNVHMSSDLDQQQLKSNQWPASPRYVPEAVLAVPCGRRERELAADPLFSATPSAAAHTARSRAKSGRSRKEAFIVSDGERARSRRVLAGSC